MLVIAIQAFGVLVFLVGSLWLGKMIRRTGSRTKAENASRISHALFWGALVLPGTAGLIYPGLEGYDEILGMPGLPAPHVWFVTGIALLFLGLALMLASNRFLLNKGQGAAAFMLTKRLVTDGL